jgi:MFS family permease
MQTKLAVKLGNPLGAAWWLPSYTLSLAVSFLLFGVNSDLFGHRWFILAGNIIVGIGHVICASAKGIDQFIVGLVIIGIGAGNSQLALCAIPELLPNKYRHIGIVISDGLSFFAVICGPIIGRFAIESGPTAWR